MGRSWTGIDFDAEDEIAAEHKLTFAERWVLVKLTGIVDYKTKRIEGTVPQIAERMGMTPRHLRPKLVKLAAEQLIRKSFPQGHVGYVEVTCYARLAHERSQRSNRP